MSPAAQKTEWEVKGSKRGSGSAIVRRDGSRVTVRWFDACTQVTFTEEHLDAFLTYLDAIKDHPDVWLEMPSTGFGGPAFACRVTEDGRLEAGQDVYYNSHKFQVPYDKLFAALKSALGKPRWQPRTSPDYQKSLATPDNGPE